MLTDRYGKKQYGALKLADINQAQVGTKTLKVQSFKIGGVENINRLLWRPAFRNRAMRIEGCIGQTRVNKKGFTLPRTLPLSNSCC